MQAMFRKRKLTSNVTQTHMGIHWDFYDVIGDSGHTRVVRYDKDHDRWGCGCRHGSIKEKETCNHIEKAEEARNKCQSNYQILKTSSRMT